MFAAHHRLANLVAIVDANGQQALGRTSEVLDLEPLSKRWEAFGWGAREVDGHDPVALAGELEELDAGADRPHAFIARTTFGKGVSYMEGELQWHYWPMSDEQYGQAVRELDAAGGHGR